MHYKGIFVDRGVFGNFQKKTRLSEKLAFKAIEALQNWQIFFSLLIFLYTGWAETFQMFMLYSYLIEVFKYYYR